MGVFLFYSLSHVISSIPILNFKAGFLWLFQVVNLILNPQTIGMKTQMSLKNNGTLQQFFLNLIHKIVQQPDIYPVKYYKKGDRIRKNKRDFSF
jgi:hypothetical protein